MGLYKRFENGVEVESVVTTDPQKLTDEEQIAAWLAENSYAAALVRGLNKPATDPTHIPVNKALTDAALVGKIKANFNRSQSDA